MVTWRPLTQRDLEGYDSEATLETRAENMMKRICQNFCEWLDSLGGTVKIIDEEVLRDMFEIDFSAEACRAVQVKYQMQRNITNPFHGFQYTYYLPSVVPRRQSPEAPML